MHVGILSTRLVKIDIYLLLTAQSVKLTRYNCIYKLVKCQFWNFLIIPKRINIYLIDCNYVFSIFRLAKNVKCEKEQVCIPLVINFDYMAVSMLIKR